MTDRSASFLNRCSARTLLLPCALATALVASACGSAAAPAPTAVAPGCGPPSATAATATGSPGCRGIARRSAAGLHGFGLSSCRGRPGPEGERQYRQPGEQGSASARGGRRSSAARWAREVEEYQPYPTDDLSFAKLRQELAKYNPGLWGVVDQIIASLSL